MKTVEKNLSVINLSEGEGSAVAQIINVLIEDLVANKEKFSSTPKEEVVSMYNCLYVDTIRKLHINMQKYGRCFIEAIQNITSVTN